MLPITCLLTGNRLGGLPDAVNCRGQMSQTLDRPCVSSVSGLEHCSLMIKAWKGHRPHESALCRQGLPVASGR